MGGAGQRDYERDEKAFGGGGYGHYLDCNDGYNNAGYICPNFITYTL